MNIKTQNSHYTSPRPITRMEVPPASKRSRLRMLKQTGSKLNIMNRLDSFLYAVVTTGVLLAYVIAVIDITGVMDKIFFTVVFLPTLAACLYILRDVWTNK